MGTWLHLLQTLNGLREYGGRSSWDAIAFKLLLCHVQQGLAGDLVVNKTLGMSFSNMDFVNSPTIDLICGPRGDI